MSETAENPWLVDEFELDDGIITAVILGGVRYVKERTCQVNCFDDGVDEAMDGEWTRYSEPTWYLTCGHESQGGECPKFCPECGARVVG